MNKYQTLLNTIREQISKGKIIIKKTSETEQLLIDLKNFTKTPDSEDLLQPENIHYSKDNV